MSVNGQDHRRTSGTPVRRDCRWRHRGPPLSGYRRGAGDPRRVPAARVTFAGTARGLEARVIPREGFELDVIRSAGLKGKSWRARARGASLLLPSALDAWRIISTPRAGGRDWRRRVQLGAGGAPRGPPGHSHHGAGAKRGAGSHESSAGARGQARRPSPTTRRFHFSGRGFVPGNPVRPGILRGAPDGVLVRGAGAQC